ncbi:MAG: AI-2E family transporter [Spirochaetota bacterium]
MTKRSFTMLDAFFILLLAGLTLAFFVVIQPFLITIFLSAVITTVFHKPYTTLNGALGNRRYLAAGITVFTMLLVIAVPLALIGLMIYTEVVGGYFYITESWPELSRRLREIEVLSSLSGVPLLSEALEGLDVQSVQLDELLRNAISASGDLIVSTTQRSFANIAAAGLNMFVFVVLFFFMLVDGDSLMQKIRALTPLSTHEVDRISHSARDIVIATLITTFGLGIIEGGLGALFFLLFGLPSPFLWGMVMVILSIIPMLGANLVMYPAGVLLIIVGSPLGGIALIILSTAAVTFTQDVMRPAVLGERSGMHPAIILLSTLGGIAWLGIVGFLVGPLLAALFVVIWTEFGTRFQHELSRRDRSSITSRKGAPRNHSKQAGRRRSLRPEPGITR